VVVKILYKKLCFSFASSKFLLLKVNTKTPRSQGFLRLSQWNYELKLGCKIPFEPIKGSKWCFYRIVYNDMCIYMPLVTFWVVAFGCIREKLVWSTGNMKIDWDYNKWWQKEVCILAGLLTLLGTSASRHKFLSQKLRLNQHIPVHGLYHINIFI
jgi:hypothetical protein